MIIGLIMMQLLGQHNISYKIIGLNYFQCETIYITKRVSHCCTGVCILVESHKKKNSKNPETEPIRMRELINERRWLVLHQPTMSHSGQRRGLLQCPTAQSNSSPSTAPSAKLSNTHNMSSEAPGHKTRKTVLLHSCCDHTESRHIHTPLKPHRGRVPHAMGKWKSLQRQRNMERMASCIKILSMILHDNNSDGQG